MKSIVVLWAGILLYLQSVSAFDEFAADDIDVSEEEEEDLREEEALEEEAEMGGDDDYGGYVTADHMEELFSLMDKDSNKVLDEDEIRSWLETVHSTSEQKQADREFLAIDKDNDGQLSSAELHEAYYADEEGQSADQDGVNRRMKAVDTNKDGQINPEEFRSLLYVGSNQELLEVEIGEILKNKDTNNDGAIDFEEFKDADEEDVAQAKAEFGDYDKNGDGKIDMDELKQLVSEHHVLDLPKEVEKIKADLTIPTDEPVAISKERFLEDLNLRQSKLTDYGRLAEDPEAFGLSAYPPDEGEPSKKDEL